MTAFRKFALVLAVSWPLCAAAQWQWIDKDGRKVFSDRPPPPEVPAAKILKQPAGKAGAVLVTDTPAAPAAEATPAARAAASAPRLSGKEKELEDKKKQAEAADAERKKADEARLAQDRAENCRRARQSKAGFDSGVRIFRTNEKGEPEPLDDQQRAAEVRRLEGIISRDCK